MLLGVTVLTAFAGCGEAGPSLPARVQPQVVFDAAAAGSAQVSGHAFNADPTKIKVVVYALRDEWYIQPQIDVPFTNISADGSWESSTHPWDRIEVLL